MTQLRTNPTADRPPPSRLQLGEGLCTVRPQGDGELLDQPGLHLGEWTAPGLAEIVKTGPHRTVYRLRLPGGVFYLKHFRADWKLRLRSLVRPAPAVLEWRHIEQIERLGIPTTSGVAVGRAPAAGSGDSFLVTRGIEEVVQLDDLVLQAAAQPDGLDRRTRSELAALLGSLVGKLHRAQWIHRDLHAGNLLVRVNDDRTAALWLIDLHALHRTRRQLSAANVVRNLSMLNNFLSRHTTRTDRWRFFRSYWQTAWAGRAGDLPFRGDVRTAVRAVEEGCGAARFKAWNKADRKWARGNRRLRIVNGPRSHCRGLARYDRPVLEAVAADPERLLAADAARCWIKRTDRRRVAKIACEIEGTLIAGICKARASSGLLDWLKWLVRSSAARRAWETGHALLRRGISTPLPLLFAESRQDRGLRHYLVTEEIRDAAPASKLLRERLPRLEPTAQDAWLRRYGRLLADQLGLLHRCGFDHRDLKANNVLVASEPTDCRLWLLDLDAVRRWPWLPPARVVQNLARIEVSVRACSALRRTHRLRFLRRYLGDRDGSDWKRYWRRIERRSARMIAENRRRGRPAPT